METQLQPYEMSVTRLGYSAVKNRIYLNMALLSAIVMLIVSIFLFVVFYLQFATDEKRELWGHLEYFTNDTAESALSELENIRLSDIRATLLLANGHILYDNALKNTDIENHLAHEEIQQALDLGVGESSRRSGAFWYRTFYCAIRLSDGSILRFAKTSQSIWGLYAGSVPIIFCSLIVVIIASSIVADKLTKRIVAPINELNPDGELSVPYDELAPFVRTISRQRKKIAEDYTALQKSADTIRGITENMNEGIIMVDAKGLILSINNSAMDIFNLSSSMNGRSIREISEDISFIEGIKNALSGNTENITFSKDDKIFSLIFSPVSKTGAIIFLLDITEKTLADARRREFSANVSHELKTPLTSISGNAEMLYDGVVKEKDKKRFYKSILDESSRLITLIEDIIKVSELDEKTDLLDKETLNLSDLAEECTEALSGKATENSIHIQINGTGIIYGNYSMMYEMFYNLMDNAIKYNKPNGSVLIDISTRGAQTTISISDTGIGIPVGERSRVFERFYRVDKSRSKKTGDTGLGLAIVKHIVMVHGGSVWIDNTYNGGTKIDVKFKQSNQSRLS